MDPDLGVMLGDQWRIIRGMIANKTVKNMVAHCCDANINLKFTERSDQAFALFPIEVDL